MNSELNLQVLDYLRALPEARHLALSEIRQVILKNLPDGYQESFNFGMITYEVPLEVCPETYNGKPLMYAALASKKNFISVYLLNVYVNPELNKWFKDEYAKTGKKLDMGKSCIRVKKLQDLPLELIGKAIAATPINEFVQTYKQTTQQ